MIIVRIMGGLGNQLFQYAYAANLRELGYEVYIDAERPYRNFVEEQKYIERNYQLNNFNILLPTINMKNLKGWKYLNNSTLADKVFLELGKKECLKNCFIKEEWVNENWKPGKFKNYYLWGTYQNEAYIKNVRGQLLRELTPKKKIKIQANLKALLSSREVVGVHIRRGDYLEHQKELGLCSIEYYRKAIQYIKKQVISPVFFFFSDDLAWVQENIIMENGEEYYYINEDSKLQDYEELLVMSKCRHNIIANSSFSWWGAWLNRNVDKIVIAPKVWFRNGLNSNIVAKGWKRI